MSTCTLYNAAGKTDIVPSIRGPLFGSLAWYSCFTTNLNYDQTMLQYHDIVELYNKMPQFMCICCFDVYLCIQVGHIVQIRRWSNCSNRHPISARDCYKCGFLFETSPRMMQSNHSMAATLTRPHGLLIYYSNANKVICWSSVKKTQ